jgi:M6 family metalloprotease-like protein
MTTPFYNEEFTFSNPDGSTIRVRGWGNQYYAVFETMDGYTVVKDPQSGFYTYARLSDDKSDLLPSDARVGEVDPVSLGIEPHLRVTPDSAKRKAMSAPMLQERKPRWQERRDKKKAQLTRLMPDAAAENRPQAANTVGNYAGLCILIEFPDISPTIDQGEVTDFCNKQGYVGFGNNGSVRDYFSDNSRGKLTYTNAVTDYYTAEHDRSYYTDAAVSYGARARELIVEALDHLKSHGFDFSRLTSDSAGYIRALNVFYVGPRVNNWAEGLWPHSWVLASDYDAGGGKKFRDYQITNMGSALTLRTFCHENGHMICDFPDLYDYGGESAGVGNYCLMCHGGNDRNPVQICAYLKNEAGWATSVEKIAPGVTANLTAGDNDFYVYARSSTEYFIMENRQKAGRDSFLPDAGLAIWHVDENGSNNNEQMTPALHYECSLEQADNRFDLEKGANAGDSDDLFSAPDKTVFSDHTNPNANWWDGTESGLHIAEISAVGATMTFVSPAASGWIYNKLVVNTYGHVNRMLAYAVIEGMSGWKKITQESSDGVTNVLDILKVARANGRRVHVYLGSDGEIKAAIML